MINCSNCGAVNETDRSTCRECGMPISSGTVKKNINKSLLLLGGSVLILIAVVFGAVKAFATQNGKISSAAVHTLSAISEEEQTNFRKFISLTEKLLEKGDFSLQASFSGGALSMDLNADYSRSAKKIRGDVTLDDFGLDFSVKKKEVQIRFPGEYEVYGFKLEDINKLTEKLNNATKLPILGNLIPVKLPTDLNLDPFAKTDFKGFLKSICGEEYKAFMKTVKIEKWNKETISAGGSSKECRVYKISWKSEAANKLLGSLASGGVLPNVGSLVNSILPEMSPYVYCYIDSDNYLAAVRFAVAGSKCFLVLEGVQNPWDKITLTAESMTGEIKVYEGGVTRNNSEIFLTLKDGDRVVCLMEYNDDNGDFCFSTVSAGVLLSGQVISNQSESGVRLNWMASGAGEQELVCIIGKLEQTPEPLGEHYSDLLSMTWSVLENLVNDWLNN